MKTLIRNTFESEKSQTNILTAASLRRIIAERKARYMAVRNFVVLNAMYFGGVRLSPQGTFSVVPQIQFIVSPPPLSTSPPFYLRGTLT